MNPHPAVLAIAMIATSAVYFYFDRVESNIWTRIFVSAHGFLAALLYFTALLVWDATGAYRPWAAWPFTALYLVPVASMAFALFQFRGPKWLHVCDWPYVGDWRLAIG
jgi:hypothetical protein